MNLTVADIIAATGASANLTVDQSFTGVVTDSRRVAAGDLFVCIVGEHQDGHDYAAAALAAGAGAVLASREVDGPALLVPDTLLAYGAIAKRHRGLLPGQVIAITGSSGKTSTKDLLAQILATAGSVVAPPGSFNNEVGLPATVLTADRETDYLVLEMGMRGKGQIAYLCDIARPQVAAVLNVGSAHLELLGSRQGIAEAKSEIIQALPPSGTAVLLADDPLVLELAAKTPAKVLTFGEANHADVRISELTLDERARASFKLNYGGDSVRVQLQLAGEHQALNAAAAAACAIAAGMGLTEVGKALSQAGNQSRWRMEVTELPNGITLVNDAYNANPESMRAGLKALKAMSRGRRSWAILGEMRELGGDSVAAHDEIGRLCVRLDINRLIAIGSAGKIIQIGAAQEGSWGNEAEWVPDNDAAVAKVLAEVEPGAVIYIKASRAVGLERVADALIAGLSGENSRP